MIPKMILAGMAAITIALPGAAMAQAVYNFTFTGSGGNVLGMGTFTTGTANPTGSFFTPSLLITAITGTYRGADITGLLAANSYYSNDNIFYTKPPAGSGYLDLDGVAFTTTAGTADFYRGLGGYGTIFTKTGAASASSTNIGGSFVVSLAPSAVPEPASWAMMILGMGAIGFVMRRRKVTTRVSYAG